MSYLRYLVSDSEGVIRKFAWKNEAMRFIGTQEDLRITTLPKPEKEDVYGKCIAQLGEAPF
jgi:hypothetical protein